MDILANANGSNGSETDTFALIADICLAGFSLLNFVINFALLLLCSGFIRNGCHSSGDMGMRRPHYGLHFFIFHCALSACLLEFFGTLTNVGYLFTGMHILIEPFESPVLQGALKKILDFTTYALFNVSHLNFVLLLNVDKLLYVLRPLHYHELMNRKRVCLICVVTWLVGLAMASPSLIYVDKTNFQVRQESILFAMCVVCPASFELLSAIIVSTLVYRIQVRDSRTRHSIRPPPPSASRRRLFSRTATAESGAGLSEELQRANLRAPSRATGCQNFFRHCRVFLKAFTPIIWTCATSLPYVTTMMYLYFGTESNEEFYRRWTDAGTDKLLRAFGCLYLTYFTGVPFIIVFTNHPYKKRITTLVRLVFAKSRDFNRRVYSRAYAAALKADHATSTSFATNNITAVTSPTNGNKDGYTCPMLSCTEV